MGTCVELERCENLSALRFKTPQTHIDRLYVSLSQCGIGQSNQPMVCCTQSPFPSRSVSGTNYSPPTKLQVVTEPVLKKESSECSVLLDNRIFGGRETKINEMPFTALLAYSKSVSDSIC